MLRWLWVIVNTTVDFFISCISVGSKEALEALIEDWKGIPVSDGFRVFQQWLVLRQTRLAHLIRTDKALWESTKPDIAAFGRKAAAEL